MRKKEPGGLSGYWPEADKKAQGRERSENRYLVPVLILIFIVSNPFFAPFLAVCVFRWLK